MMPRQLVALFVFFLMIHPAGAAEIRIQGLRQIDEGRAREKMEPFMDYIEARPATAARAEDAAFFLRLILLRDGFVSAEVDGSAMGAELIILTVKEGARLTLGEVGIRGVPAEAVRDELVNAFREPASGRATGFGTGDPFLEEDLEPALDSLVAEFQSQGYWEAQVRVARRWITPGELKVNFIIHATPGQRFIIGAPTIRGDAGGHDAGILARLADFNGRVADAETIDEARVAVEEYMHSRGYAYARIEKEATLSGNAYIMNFHVRAGRHFRVGDIAILGLDKTDPARIGARFAGLQGRLYDHKEFNEPVISLLGTGSFASIRTRREPRDDGTMDFTLEFTEGPAKGVTGYIGAGSFEGIILGSSYFDRNFSGKLFSLTIRGEVTSRGLLGEVQLANPWLFQTDIHAFSRLFAVTRDYDGYDKQEFGISATFTRDITERHQIALSAGSSSVEVDPDGISRDQLGQTRYSHHFLKMAGRFEHRNQPLNPDSGFYGEIHAQAGAALGSESTGYFQAGGRASHHIPIGENHQLALGLRTGLIIPSRGRGGLPIDLRFFMGGPGSVRSFPERRLGELSDSNDPLGGEAFWTLNIEYIHQLIGPLKAVAFTDAGNLSRKYSDYTFDRPDVAVGGGLRLDLPIGPLRVEYGHNMTRDSGEPGGTFHFAFGLAF